MRKGLSMALELLGHKLRFGFQIKPNGRDSLKKRDDKVVRDYSQGYTTKRLADKYSLTENRISQILTCYGARKPKWRKMSEETRRTIFQLEKKGLSKAEIGRKVGVSRERVRQILQQGA
ncbi:MAG TPA: sigma factor-like helix-turn-helix DNA-binding protein [archaeon]|nr:sigma factor-like helix-turn-helix DNA-binding protein [archaeon]